MMSSDLEWVGWETQQGPAFRGTVAARTEMPVGLTGRDFCGRTVGASVGPQPPAELAGGRGLVNLNGGRRGC